jgi:putative glutathione S-transferase
MGHLLNGSWTMDDVLSEIQNGYYVKRPSRLRNFITADGSSGFKAEAGRYHLYSSIGCPWAHRTELFRVLKKLDGLIGVTDTAQSTDRQGWWFGEAGHAVPGAGREVRYLHEVYTIADADYTGRVTVPTLWDIERQTIVSNESSEIIRMFNSEFAALAEPSPDYCPDDLVAEIDAMNERVLSGINNGVNRCGRSTTQEAYEESFDMLFATLDEIEELLGRQRYLCGERQTEADWRLYPNLIRFDSVYYIGYKCNKRRLEDYPNLSNYLRELYQTPGIADVSDVEGMKRNSFDVAGPIRANGIVPKGPDLGLWRPHDRDRLEKAA